MEGRVLIVESMELVRLAMTRLLVRRGYQVVAVDSGRAASCLPHRFRCGIFGTGLPDVSPISLVGWFLVEKRIDAAVFFGNSEDPEVRLRASNLGLFVAHREGVNYLVRAALDYMLDEHPLPGQSGVPSLRIGALQDPEIRRRVVV